MIRPEIEVLDKDLTISTPQGYNWITQNDLHTAREELATSNRELCVPFFSVQSLSHSS